MKVRDKLKQMVGINEDIVEKFMAYNMLGSFFNILEEAVEEIKDEEVSKKFSEFLELIMKKREECGDIEIAETTSLDSRGKK